MNFVYEFVGDVVSLGETLHFFIVQVFTDFHSQVRLYWQKRRVLFYFFFCVHLLFNNLLSRLLLEFPNDLSLLIIKALFVLFVIVLPR